MSKLTNKVAVVTGGSSGIGFATAQRFIADGAQVVITGRNQGALDTAVTELGDRATGIHGDVANLEDLERLFAQVQEQFGRVDVLFANAGIAPLGPFEAVTQEHFDGCGFHTDHAAIRTALRSGRSVSSTAGSHRSLSASARS